MTKAEILKQLREKEQERYENFLKFIQGENFIETIDKVGNFGLGLPLFYKKVSENVYLLFNLPTFKNIKKNGFCADFWRIYAKSENEFLKTEILKENLIDLRLGFDYLKDSDLYKEELSKY